MAKKEILSRKYEEKTFTYAGYIYALVGFLIGCSSSWALIRGLTINKSALAISAIAFELGITWITKLSADDYDGHYSAGKQVQLTELVFKKHIVVQFKGLIRDCSSTIYFASIILLERVFTSYFSSLYRILQIQGIRLILYTTDSLYYYGFAILLSVLKLVACCTVIFYNSKHGYALYTSFAGAWRVLMSIVTKSPIILLYTISITIAESFFPHFSPSDIDYHIKKCNRDPLRRVIKHPKILNILHTPRNIVILSMYTGLVSGIGIGLLSMSGKIFGLGVYIYLFGQFNALEYICLSLYKRVNLSDFMLINGIGYYLAFFSSLLEYFINYKYFHLYKDNVYTFQIISSIAACLFQVMRSASILNARNCFSHSIYGYGSTPNRLVTNGLYSITRHPSYVAFYGYAIFCQLTTLCTFNLIFHSIILFFFFKSTVKEEEKLLIETFGDEYVAYKKKTGIFPFKNLFTWRGIQTIA